MVTADDRVSMKSTLRFATRSVTPGPEIAEQKVPTSQTRPVKTALHSPRSEFGGTTRKFEPVVDLSRQVASWEAGPSATSGLSGTPKKVQSNGRMSLRHAMVTTLDGNSPQFFADLTASAEEVVVGESGEHQYVLVAPPSRRERSLASPKTDRETSVMALPAFPESAVPQAEKFEFARAFSVTPRPWRVAVLLSLAVGVLGALIGYWLASGSVS